jgi:TetR/AcrR family transcriptional regulator, ethionamide resistance regulator
MSASGRRRAPTKGDRREQALLDALEDLLDEQPIARLSVDQIASAAGVSRTSFYFYFPSKEAAVMRLVERSVATIWQAPDSWLVGDGEPRSGLEHALAEVVRVWKEHGAVLAAVVEAAAYDRELWEFWRGLLEGFIEASAQRIRRDQQAGIARAGIDPRATAEALCWMNERYCYAALAAASPARPAAEVRRGLLDVWTRVVYRD